MLTIFFSDFENKIIRLWIENFIEKLNRNAQSSTDSTHIQRIAKKTQASTTANIKQTKIVTLPIYPLFINPYYHPTITYSNYIPSSYSATSHLIPISQVPYQQEEYHHRFLIPFYAKFPDGYTHIPISTPTINNYPSKTKKLEYTLSDITSPHNSDDFQIYNMPGKEINIPIDETPINTTNKILNHNHSDNLDQIEPYKDNFEEPIKIYQIKDENDENFKPTKDQKKLDIINNLPSSMSIEPNQMNESQEQSFSKSDTKLITSRPPKNSLKKAYVMSTVEPIAISKITSHSNIISDINNQDSQISFDTDYHLTNTLTATTHVFSELFSTQKPLLITEQPDSTLETESIAPGDSNYEETDGDNIQLSETRQVQHYPQSMENKETKIRTLNTPIKTEEKSSIEITKILNRESTSPYLTTKYVSTPKCENNDCLTTKSSLVAIQNTYTLHNDPLHVRSVYSTPQSSTVVINEHDLQSDLIKPSTHSSPSFTNDHSVISEITTLPHTISHSIKSPSSSPFLEVTTSNQTSFKTISNKANDIQSTNLHYSSSVPVLLPLTYEKSKSSVLLETKTEQIPSIPLIYNNNTENNNQNTHKPSYYDESTNRLHLTTITIPSKGITEQKSFVKTDQNNQFSSKSTSFRSSNSEKENIHEDDKTHHNISFTANTRKKNSTITTSPLKSLYTSNQKYSHLVTDPADSKYKKFSKNREWQTTEIPEDYKDSDPWYKYMYTQKPQKKELNDDQIDYLLQKLVKSLTYEIEKQTISKESLTRILAPQLGDQVFIIHPLGKDASKLMETEVLKKQNSTGQLKNVNEQ